MKKKFSMWTVAAVMVLGLIIGFQGKDLISADNIYEQINKFKDVLVLADKYYVDPVNLSKLTQGAIDGMLDQLDPHSVYFPPKAFAQASEEMRGNYQGVGLMIRALNDTIIVSEPMGGGPAAMLGILSNDRIVGINDSSAVGLTADQASQRLRGPKGTQVKVTIMRPGERELLVYDITRNKISINSVDVAMMVNDDVGYIHLNKFSENTDREMNDALQKLHTQGMKELILDLRYNPGGILEEAVRVADLFLDGGTKDKPKTIVYTKARATELQEKYVATSGSKYEKLPLIILINAGSASASEIVSGAIQDWDRGLIVGETSFGKGLVQRQWPFSDGSALRLTIARYYTPSGRLIQRSYEGKDRAEYEREAFQRTQQEGNNLEHERDIQTKADSSRPVFHTNSGRLVYGGGGITPDYFVKPTSLTQTMQNLGRRDMFYQFVTSYLGGEGRGLRSAYDNNLKGFLRNFDVSDKMLEEFQAFVKSKDVKIDEKDFQKDIDVVKAMLKAQIARAFWGNDGWYPVTLTVDAQFEKALQLLPEAVKIAGLK